MNKIIMITGANSGIGKESARQLALKPETEKVILACRNLERALEAKEDLERKTGKKIFEVLIMDVSNPKSVKKALSSFEGEIDALIMNAGGIGGKQPQKITEDGVTFQFASNVLGHAILLENLIDKGRLRNVALFASSEAARGIKKMGIKAPEMRTYSVEEFRSIFDGSFFGKEFDPMQGYAYTKYVASLWMASLARKHKNLKLISVSPGATSGTSAMDTLPLGMKLFYKYFAMPIMLPLRGMIHSVEKGSKRFVDAIGSMDLNSGVFYASKENTVIGPLVDQGKIQPDFLNPNYQDNAGQAISSLIR